MHHTGEDELLWPLLLERAAPSTGLVETMQAQHHRVDEYADQVDPLVTEWRSNGSAVRGEQLARVLEQFARALFEHLDLEEREILPLVSRYITVEGVGQPRRARQGVDVRQAAAAPVRRDPRGRLAGRASRGCSRTCRPRSGSLMRTVGARQYRRYITRVRAA